MDKFSTVAISRADTYDTELIKKILTEHFSLLEIDLSQLRDKRVVIKPNLVMKKAPDAAATTHPAVLDALLSVLFEAGVTPIIAESSGGIYSKARMDAVYRACGIADVAKKYGNILNEDMSSGKMNFRAGKAAREFDIITPIKDADVIFDLCKLKSHSLTKMSGAVKNFFGVVPGITKFEMHAAYPENDRFCAMICDLCKMICENKRVIAVTDAIVGMEGNGPTGGNPKKIGCIITSENPFASDLLSEKLLGFENTVPMLRDAASRGYMPQSADELTVLGDDPSSFILSDFAEPDSTKKSGASALQFFSQGKLGELFAPRPSIDVKKCRGCGECHNSCPQHTIEMREKKGKKYAVIEGKKCIRCFCCQELCPFIAIDTKKNFLLNIISAIK